MKTKINTLVFAITAILVFGAFQSKQSSTLIGSWKLESFKAAYPDTMSAKAKAAAEADMKDLGTRLKKSTFVFNANGQLWYLGRKGKWAINGESKTVNFISNTNEKSTITIVKLSPGDFVFTRVDDGITQTFHLVRFIKAVR